MTICTNCQRALTGSFCSHCGVAGTGTEVLSQSVRLLAALSYFLQFWSLLFLFIDPYRKINLVRFHVFQGLLLIPVMMVITAPIMYWVAMSHGDMRVFWQGFALCSIPFFMTLWAAVGAFRGRRAHLPLIGRLAARLADGDFFR